MCVYPHFLLNYTGFNKILIVNVLNRLNKKTEYIRNII